MNIPRFRPAAVAWFVSALVAESLATFPAAGAAHAADLTVTIAGVRSNSGDLLIGLYDTAAGYRQATANAGHMTLLEDRGRLIGATMRARTGSQSISFNDLPPGHYAVIVYHDQNDNGVLDQDATGIPTEGYGFSNDASGFLGPPSFDAAAITLGNASIDATISLGYPSPEPQARLGK